MSRSTLRALPLVFAALTLWGCPSFKPHEPFTGRRYCPPGQTDGCRQCARLGNCTKYGLCAYKGPFQCKAGSDADCQQSRLCKRKGNCTNVDGGCRIKTSDDCRRSRLCKRNGRCTAVEGEFFGFECAACQDEDCRPSRDCKRDGKCFAQDTKCVAQADESRPKAKACLPKPVPKKAARPAEPKLLEQVRVAVQLKEGLTPCVLRFVGSIKEWSGSFSIYAITRIEVEESEHCAADVVLDASEYGSLAGNSIPKLDVAARRSASRGMLKDLNFDGYLDLAFFCLRLRNYFKYRNWVFEPKTRKFVPLTVADELRSPEFDPKTQTVSSGGRIAGRSRLLRKHRWIGGKLVEFFKEITHNERDPKGNPLPPGHAHVTRWELQGGALTKTFDGVVVISLKP